MTHSTIRGYLKILVLKALAENPKTGYNLMKFVEEHIGNKPSPGSMYPLLDKLKEEKLVIVKGKAKTKEYKLTPKGRERLNLIEEKRLECLDNFVNSMKMLSTLTGEDMSMQMQLIEKMRKGEMPFKELNPEMTNLQTVLHTMLEKDKIKVNAKKIKKIFANVIKELKKL